MTAAGDKRNDRQADGVWEPPPPSGSAWPGQPPAGFGNPGPSQTGPYSQAVPHSYGRPSPNGTGSRTSRPEQPITSDEFAELCRTIGSSVAKVSEAVGQAISASVSNGVKSAKEAKGKAPAKPRAPKGQPSQAAPRPPVATSPNILHSLNAQAAAKVELKRRDALVNARFKKPGGLQASGIVMTSIGAVSTVVFSGALVAVLATADFSTVAPTAVATIMMGGFTAASAALLFGGIRRLQAAGRLQSFRRIFGTREACSIDEIAAQLHQGRAKTLKQARSILKRGLLPQGRIDDECTTLMVTDSAYHHYRQLQASRQQNESASGQAAITNVTDVASEPRIDADSLPPKARAFVNQGRTYLDRLRRLDSDIADAAVSAKIEAIEQVVAKILERAQAHPAAVDDLGRLMDYYLPTTVKLLEAYDSLEEQPVQGENITASRREIEQTLDVLQAAFEKLLDATFEDLSLDVSSDISVLNTILAQEGLTESPFTTSTERNPR